MFAFVPPLHTVCNSATTTASCAPRASSLSSPCCASSACTAPPPRPTRLQRCSGKCIASLVCFPSHSLGRSVAHASRSSNRLARLTCPLRGRASQAAVSADGGARIRPGTRRSRGPAVATTFHRYIASRLILRLNRALTFVCPGSCSPKHIHSALLPAGCRRLRRSAAQERRFFAGLSVALVLRSWYALFLAMLTPALI